MERNIYPEVKAIQMKSRKNLKTIANQSEFGGALKSLRYSVQRGRTTDIWGRKKK